MCRLPVVFHGTLGDALPGIVAGGIRFAEGEPSFTADLRLACCKYANQSGNKTRFYSGQTLRAARELVRQQVVASTESDEDLLVIARRYWDRHYAEGAVFCISTLHWHPMSSPEAQLKLSRPRLEVSGGITKWIECHLTLQGGETTGETVRPRRRLCVPPSELVFQIPSTPATRDILDQLARQAVGLCNRPLSIDALLDVLATAVPGPGMAESVSATSLAWPILAALHGLAVRAALRRGVLSVLRTWGFRIIKSDYTEPYEEEARVFWPSDEIGMRLECLARALGQTRGREKGSRPWLLAASPNDARDEAIVRQSAEDTARWRLALDVVRDWWRLANREADPEPVLRAVEDATAREPAFAG